MYFSRVTLALELPEVCRLQEAEPSGGAVCIKLCFAQELFDA